MDRGGLRSPQQIKSTGGLPHRTERILKTNGRMDSGPGIINPIVRENLQCNKRKTFTEGKHISS